jgi:cytochrome c oxidase assembly protein subunit 15
VSRAPSQRAIGAWLLVCAAFVLAMTVVGGLTRLTRAGLSIVEWQPITGLLPPLSEAAWTEAFEAYRSTPEGRLVNHAMELDGFQEIYLVEWAHRLLGRITGFVVLLPFLYFLARRRLSGSRAARVLGIFALGGLQGFLGWFMVQSGLVDEPRVSHYRLAMHLALALLILGALVWTALDEFTPPAARASASAAPRAFAWGTLVFVALTVVWGAFMAGLHAGHVAPTFPDMNGTMMPTFTSLFDDALGVHFAHRALAWCAALGALATFAVMHLHPAPSRIRALSSLLVLVLGAQMALGAFTVVLHVPIMLAALHQANGALLVTIAVALVHSLRRS